MLGFIQCQGVVELVGADSRAHGATASAAQHQGASCQLLVGQLLKHLARVSDQQGLAGATEQDHRLAWRQSPHLLQRMNVI